MNTKCKYSSISILLVEDSITNQQIAYSILLKLGTDCTVASNGCEAIQMVQTQKFDLILMDCCMPEMNGFMAAKAIRNLKSEKFLTIPIIAITSDTQDDIISKCKKSGMNDFIAKPFSFGSLKSTIDKWVLLQEILPEIITPVESKADDNYSEIIDIKNLLKRTNNDEKFVKIVIQAFYADTGKKIEDIKTFHSNGEFKKISIPAHTIKGAALNIGATELSKVAFLLETASKESLYHEIGFLITQIETKWKEIGKELSRLKYV